MAVHLQYEEMKETPVDSVTNVRKGKVFPLQARLWPRGLVEI